MEIYKEEMMYGNGFLFTVSNGESNSADLHIPYDIDRYDWIESFEDRARHALRDNGMEIDDDTVCGDLPVMESDAPYHACSFLNLRQTYDNMKWVDSLVGDEREAALLLLSDTELSRAKGLLEEGNWLYMELDTDKYRSIEEQFGHYCVETCFLGTEKLPDWCRKYFDYADFGDDMIDSFTMEGGYRDGDRILILW